MPTAPIQVFENVGEGKFFGWGPSDPLRLSWVGEVEWAEEEPGHVLLERVFQLLNQDERPNRYVAPSLSVGDVITLVDQEISYSVEPYGYMVLGEPIYASEQQIAELTALIERSLAEGRILPEATERPPAWRPAGGA